MEHAIKSVNVEDAVNKIIEANQDKFEQTKSNPGKIHWFVGQVMKETHGKADPVAVSALLTAKLNA